MSVATLIERVITRRQEREAVRVSTYDELVDTLVAGDKEPTPESVDAILDDVGKSTADLDRDVRTRARRRHLQEALLDKPAVEKEYASRAAKHKRQQPHVPLPTFADLSARMRVIRQAEDELIRTYDGPLLFQYDQAKADLAEWNDRRSAVYHDFVEQWKQWLDPSTRPSPPSNWYTSAGQTGMTKEEWQAEVDRNVSIAKAKQKEIAEIDRRLADLAQLMDDLREQMILA